MPDQVAYSDPLDCVERLVEKQGLFLPGAVVVCAVSGGVDSVFLLAALARMARSWPLDLHVAHINHGLRGADSDSDAQFVDALAHQMGLPFHLQSLSLAWQSAPGKRHASPESEWRAARYKALGEIAAQVRAHCVALGHNRDDLAETVLMRLLRGAGPEGLSVFGPVAQMGPMRLCRPLIETSRATIEQYARAQGLCWREDASNQDMRRLRNRLRKGLIPFLQQEFNPSIQATLARTAELARCENDFVAQQADALWGQLVGTASDGPPDRLAVEVLRGSHRALLRRVLRRWVMEISGQIYPPTYHDIAEISGVVFSEKVGYCYEYQRRYQFRKTRQHVVCIPLHGSGPGDDRDREPPG